VILFGCWHRIHVEKRHAPRGVRPVYVVHYVRKLGELAKGTERELRRKYVVDRAGQFAGTRVIQWVVAKASVRRVGKRKII
jgi:hypothetical protein